MPADSEAEALAGLFGRNADVSPDEAVALPSPAPAGHGEETTDRLRFAGAFVACAVAFAMLPLLLRPLGGTGAAVQVVAVGLAMAALGWGAARLGGTPLLGWGRAPLAWSAAGAAIGLGGLAWCALALAVGGRLRPGSAEAGAALAIGAIATLAQVFGEELLFRGWLQGALARWLPPAAAIGGSALLFGLVHGLGGVRAPLAFAVITLAGLLFGLLAWRSDGLAAPVAAHWGWNGGEQLGFGLDPNPGAGPWGALLDREVVAPALWGGGPDGLNASLPALLVLLALATALLAPRRDQPR